MFDAMILLLGEAKSSNYIHARFHGEEYKLHHKN